MVDGGDNGAGTAPAHRKPEQEQPRPAAFTGVLTGGGSPPSLVQGDGEVQQRLPGCPSLGPRGEGLWLPRVAGETAMPEE